MSSITVHLVFRGLIAFSPIYDANQLSSNMTALAVDSRLAPSNSVCVVDHMAMIRFPTSSANCVAAPDCTYTGGVCQCHLDRHEIQLQAEANPTPKALPQGSQQLPLPDSRESAGDFSYIPRLSNLGNYSLDQQFLGSNPPAGLAARFTFPFDSLLACELAYRPDNQTDNVHSFQFRKLGELGKPTQPIQPVAQELVANLAVDTTDGVPVLRLSHFGSADFNDFPLTLPANTAEGLAITIENHRPQPLPYGDPCDDGIGRDFALFYELVENPPEWSKRLLPHVKFAPSIPFVEADPTDCAAFKSPLSRPVCPLAGF